MACRQHTDTDTDKQTAMLQLKVQVVVTTGSSSAFRASACKCGELPAYSGDCQHLPLHCGYAKATPSSVSRAVSNLRRHGSPSCSLCCARSCGAGGVRALL